MNDFMPMSDAEGNPKQRKVRLTGCVMGIYSELGELCKPVIITSCNVDFLPIFTTIEKLRECFGKTGIDDDEYTVKKIDSGPEFLDSVREHLPVVLDPYLTPEGKARFLLVSEPDNHPITSGGNK